MAPAGIAALSTGAWCPQALQKARMVNRSGGENENTSLAWLADYIGSLVEEWEDMMLPVSQEASGIEVLQHLMQEHGLHQTDLPELGSQGVVSEILSGKRDLNLRQIRALAERFDVPVQWFI